MSENLMFQRKLPAKQRCDLCGSSRDNVYQVNENGYLLTFCSPDHARTGVANWEDKIAKGVKPGIPYKEEESNDEGDTTQEM